MNKLAAVICYAKHQAMLPVAKYCGLSWNLKQLMVVEGRQGFWKSGEEKGAVRVRVLYPNRKYRVRIVCPAVAAMKLIEEMSK